MSLTFKALQKRLSLLKPQAQARTQIRALCPPETTQAHTLPQELGVRLKPELKAQISA
jgi:hypothetical protein